MIATEGLLVWEALAIVAGGIVGGVGALSILAKVPGGRWLFAQLVANPLRQVVRDVIKTEVHDAVEVSVEAHVSDRLAPIAKAVDQINAAVNNVAPGSPTIKDRVARIEESQARSEGSLAVVREVVERLVQRP